MPHLPLPPHPPPHTQVLFDPHCAHLPNITALNPGKRIDFVAGGLAEAHPDQCTPLQAFGCDMEREFQVGAMSGGWEWCALSGVDLFGQQGWLEWAEQP